MILVSDRSGVGVRGPSDPRLALLWTAAQSKFERDHDGIMPQTGADWNVVTAEYHRLLGKLAGSLAETVTKIQARCHEVPGGD